MNDSTLQIGYQFRGFHFEEREAFLKNQHKLHFNVRFEVHKTMTMNSTVFFVVTLCTMVGV
jgi:hypothetical protein